MNRRGKRLTLGVMAVGIGVVLVLAIAYRKPILEHVEAWRFQLTKETATIEPMADGPNTLTLARELLFSGTGRDFPLNYLDALAVSTGCRVIIVPEEIEPETWGILPTVVESADVVAWTKKTLQRKGYRVLEQRFPRRAYVVIRDESP